MTNVFKGLLERLPDALSSSLIGLLMMVVTVVSIGVFQITGSLTLGQGLLVVQPVLALVAAASLLGGPMAVTGSVLGYVGYLAFWGTVPVWQGAEYLAFGFLIHIYATRSSLHDSSHSLRSGRDLLVISSVLGIAAFGSAALFNWAGAVTGQVPFYPTVLVSGFSRAISALIGVVLSLGVIPRLLGDQSWQSITRRLRSRSQRWNTPHGAWIIVSAGLLIAWLVLGSSVSIGFQLFDVVPTQVRMRFEFLVLFTETGPLGSAQSGIQLGIGVTVLSLWLISLYRYSVLSSGSS